MKWNKCENTMPDRYRHIIVKIDKDATYHGVFNGEQFCLSIDGSAAYVSTDEITGWIEYPED